MLTSLRVKNYRSLKDMELSLGPLVVLVGANGSGKSSILDVLRFVRQITVEEVASHVAFEERGGYEQVVWGADADAKIAMRLDWVPGLSDGGSPHVYETQFGQGEASRPVFEQEELTVPGGDGLARKGPQKLEVRFQGHVTLEEANKSYSAVIARGVKRWEGPNMLESIKDWEFYRFAPNLMRPPQPVRKEYRLVETGSNLSTVLHTLFSERHPAFENIGDLLKACVPTTEELSSPIFDEAKTYVAIKEESVPKPVGSWGLSDGTLFALALATAVSSPDPPSLIALEAPDIELHPYVMQTVAEMLTLASKRSQVIITTHSPYLLDFLPRDSLVVVEKIKGATRCKPVKDKRSLQKVVRELGAGKAWYSGHIGGVP
jgi:predicted ATPase